MTEIRYYQIQSYTSNIKTADKIQIDTYKIDN